MDQGSLRLVVSRLWPDPCHVSRHEEVLVKWEGLGYEDLSWEQLNGDLPDVTRQLAALQARGPIAKVSVPRPYNGLSASNEDKRMRQWRCRVNDASLCDLGMPAGSHARRPHCMQDVA